MLTGLLTTKCTFSGKNGMSCGDLKFQVLVLTSSVYEILPVSPDI